VLQDLCGRYCTQGLLAAIVKCFLWNSRVEKESVNFQSTSEKDWKSQSGILLTVDELRCDSIHFDLICIYHMFNISRFYEAIFFRWGGFIFINKKKQPTNIQIALLLIYISTRKTVHWTTFGSLLIRFNASVGASESRLWRLGSWYPLAVYWSWAEPAQVSTGMLKQAAGLGGQLAPGPRPAGEVPVAILMAVGLICQNSCDDLSYV